MAQGEIKWSSTGKTVAKFDRTLLPKNDYDLKFNEKDISLEKSEKPGSVPYIKVAFEVLGTATEGGKNRKLFKNFFLHLKPGKDGKVQVERQGGVLDLATGLGEEVNFSGIEVPYQQYKNDERVGSMTRIPIVDPQQALKWFKSKDGTVVRAHVKVDNSGKKSGYDPKNDVEYFIPAEVQEESGEDYSMEEGAEEEVVETPLEEVEELIEESATETEEIISSSEHEEPLDAEAEVDMTSTFNKKAKLQAVKAPPAKVAQGPAKKAVAGKRK